jgi:hypothetical protein
MVGKKEIRGWLKEGGWWSEMGSNILQTTIVKAINKYDIHTIHRDEHADFMVDGCI